MKKLLLTALTAGIMSTSAMADAWITGTIGYIQFTDTLAKVELITSDGPVVKDIDPNGVFFKEMVAVLLTAKSQSGAEVVLYSTATGWTKVKFK